jgi:hypothetical protein
MHLTMHIPVQPFFQPGGFFFKKFGPANTTGQKTKTFGFSFYKLGVSALANHWFGDPEIVTG